MDGLNSAADSTANSDRKYDPIRQLSLLGQFVFNGNNFTKVLESSVEKLFDLLVTSGKLRGNLIQASGPTSLSGIDRIEVTILCTRWWSPGVNGRSRTRDGSGASCACVRLTWTALRSRVVVSLVRRLRVAIRISTSALLCVRSNCFR